MSQSCTLPTSIHIDRCKTGRCLVCGKKLTNPKSVERSCGDRCYKRYLHGTAGIQVRIEDYGV